MEIASICNFAWIVEDFYETNVPEMKPSPPLLGL